MILANSVRPICRGYAIDRSVELKAEAKGSTQAASGGKSGKEFSSTTTKKVIKSGSGSVSDHSKVCLPLLLLPVIPHAFSLSAP